MEDFNGLNLVDGHYSVNVNGIKYSFFYRKNINIDLIFVLLPNILPKEIAIKKHDYSGLYGVFPGHIVDISSIIIDQDNMKEYRSSKNTDVSDKVIEGMEDLVRFFLNKIKINHNRLVLYSEKYGSMYAMRLGANFEDSIICINNPAVNKPNSTYISEFFGNLINKDNYKNRFNNINSKLKDHVFFIGVESKLNKGANARFINWLTNEMAGNNKFKLLVHESSGEKDNAGINCKRMIEEALDLAGIGHIKNKWLKIDISKLYLMSSDSDEKKHNDVKFRPRGRNDLEPVDLNPPYNWNYNPYNDNNWFAQIQMWRMLDDFILMYEKTKNRKWLNKTIELIYDWYKFYLINDPVKYVWADMNVGIRAMKIAYILSLHYTKVIKLSDAEIECFESLTKSHLNFILNEKNIHYSNHTFMDIHGAAALAHVVRPVYAHSIFKYCKRILSKLISLQFSNDGIHLENSPGYQKFGIICVERLIRTGWFDELNLTELMKKAKSVLDWLFMPDCRYAPIGDTSAERGAEKAVAIPYVDQNDLMNCGGYVVIKRGDSNMSDKFSYLFFMGAFNSCIHKHSDDLSLIWYEGEDILCDTGKYAYQKSEKRNYSLSTRAHNTIEIDGLDTFSPQKNSKNCNKGSFVKRAEKINDIYYILASMRIEKFKVIHTRRLLYKANDFLIVIDEIIAKEQHSYTANWHFAPHIELCETDNCQYECILRNGNKLYISGSSNKPMKSSLVYGQNSPRLQGFISQEYRKLIPNFCLGNHVDDVNCKIISAFSLSREHSIGITPDNSYKFETEDNSLEFKFIKDKVLFL